MPVSETATARLAKHLDSLPIFPLAEAVLFPHSVLPLHIFEPRYREMVQDASRAELPIAIAMLRPREVDPLDRPAVRPVAGAGFIQTLEQLPDGRYLIELAGVARVRLVREHPPERAYRRIVATLMQDSPSDPAIDAARLETLRLILAALQSSHPRAAASLVDLVQNRHDPGEVADLLASAVVADAQRRQLLLEELDPIARIDSITHHLGEVLARLRGTRNVNDLN
jgi:Lon protease-like protein